MLGHTAAEMARKGGHDDVADTIAASAAEAQLAPLRSALATGGSSAGHFDSTIARLLHLLKGAGKSNPTDIAPYCTILHHILHHTRECFMNTL